MKKTTIPLSVSVSDFLKEKIILGELEAGTHLREEHIAKELGISRIPLREALKNLESDGYVVSVPYKGAIVKRWSADEIDEARELLQSVIPLVLKAAISNYTEEDLQKIDDSYNNEHNSVCQKNLLMTLRHMTDVIYGPAKMPFAVSLIKELYVKVFQDFKALYINNDQAIEAAKEQLKIFTQLIREGDHNNALKIRVKSLNIAYGRNKKQPFLNKDSEEICD